MYRRSIWPTIARVRLSPGTSLSGARGLGQRGTILRGFQYYSRNNNYQRFRSSRPPFWQSRSFWYVAGGSSFIGAIYYQSHLEEAPITGRKRFIAISPAQEAAIGNQTYKETMAQYGRQIVPRGTPVDTYVRRVADRVIRATGITDVNWEIHVIDSPEMNAFVIPGGKVFVFTGILPITATEDGLAAVLGHEIAHQYARHVAERLSKAKLLSVIYLFASLFFDPGTVQFGSTMADLLTVLPNSRECESEADHIGLLFMAQACYDPQEAIGLWKRMKQAERSAPPQFLSTHPSSGSRIERISELIPQANMKREASNCPIDTNSFFAHFRR